MTIKTPEDFVKIGHVRPVAFVRDINPTEGYLKETRMGPEDLERLAAWCLNVAAWCRQSMTPAVQLKNEIQPQSAPRDQDHEADAQPIVSHRKVKRS